MDVSDLDLGQYHPLNEVGGRIWSLVCTGVPLAEIVDRV